MKSSIHFLIFQVCRREKLNCSIIQRRKSSTKVPSSSLSYSVPKHADFLIVFSMDDGKSVLNIVIENF